MDWKDSRLYPFLLIVFDRGFVPVRLNRYTEELTAIVAAKLIQWEHPDWQMRIIDERGCYDG